MENCPFIDGKIVIFHGYVSHNQMVTYAELIRDQSQNNLTNTALNINLAILSAYRIHWSTRDPGSSGIPEDPPRSRA